MAKSNIRLKDIAEAAQISVSATSMALSGSREISEETRRRVLTLSRKMGYQRNRSRRAQSPARQSIRIGYLLLGRRFDTGAHGLTLHTHTHVARRLGHRLEALDLPDLADRSAVLSAIDDFAEGVDGLLISGLIESWAFRRLHETGAPLALMGEVPHDPETDDPVDYDRIVPDGIAMGRLATRSLIHAGCRRILFLVDTLYPGLSMDQWRDGYRLALLDAGLALEPSWEIITGIETMPRSIEALPDSPDGFVIPDLRIARDILPILRRRGLDVGPKRVVLSGPDRLTERYNLTDYPIVYVPNDAPSNLAIRQLEARVMDRHRPGVRLSLPFEARNLPASGDDASS